MFQKVNPFSTRAPWTSIHYRHFSGGFIMPFQKRVWLLVKPSLNNMLNFIVGNKFVFSYGLFEWAEHVNIAWRQEKCRQDTAQRLNVFPPMSLLSLLRCAHACCRAGDSRFWLTVLVFLTKCWLWSFFKKLRIISCIDASLLHHKMEKQDALEFS
jgi:hypothetical protein